jgi:hypothetical protein
MVESKLVELVVAGSNPVGHPIFLSNFIPTRQPVHSASSGGDQEMAETDSASCNKIGVMIQP